MKKLTIKKRVEMAKEFKQIQFQRKEIERKEKELKEILFQDALINGNFAKDRIFYGIEIQRRNLIDSEKAKKEHPELYSVKEIQIFTCKA